MEEVEVYPKQPDQILTLVYPKAAETDVFKWFKQSINQFTDSTFEDCTLGTPSKTNENLLKYRCFKHNVELNDNDTVVAFKWNRFTEIHVLRLTDAMQVRKIESWTHLS